MKKLLYVMMIIAVGWLLKLSYDVISVKNQLIETQNHLRKSEQTTAHLNDQLVALQRKSSAIQSSSTEPVKNTPIVSQIEGVNPVELIQQQLELAGFAVQQQQYIYALETLNKADQMSNHYDLSEAVKLGLQQAITQDKATIQQYVSARSVQEQQLSEALQIIDASLNAEIQSSELQHAQDVQSSWWSRWFKVDYVEQQTPTILNRKMILKETQLRIILAQRALARGEMLEYQAIMDVISAQLGELPDAYSLKLKQNIQKIRQTKMNPIPKLSSLAILES